MEKRIIEIIVNDEYVLGSGVVIGAAGDDESVALRTSFNDTWLGLNIYATFRDARGENPVAVLLCPSMLVPGEVRTYDVVVPKSATAIDGKLCVVFSGFVVTGSRTYNAEENKYDQLVYRDAVINTTNAYFRVLPSDFSALDEEDQKEATPLEQLLGEINDFRTELTANEEGIGNRLSKQDDRISAVETAEAGRADAETARCSAEEEREAAEANREQERENFENSVNARLDEQDAKLAGRLGESGSVTLFASKWSSANVQAITITGLRDDDMVIFYPATADDREYCGYYGVFVSPESEGGAFTVTARAIPAGDISLRYYVIRGSLPEIEEAE